MRTYAPNGDVVEAYHRLLNDPDPETRRRAAHAWCLWESATPKWPPASALAERFEDPNYAVAFARIVTHFIRNNAWLEDGALLRDARVLAGHSGSASLDRELAWATDRFARG